MKPIWKIRALAIALIVLFGLGTLVAAYAIFTGRGEPHMIFAAITNLGFIVGGVGLLRLKRWSWWLTIVLCAVSIIHLLWQIFTSLTPDTATKQNETVAYVVAGFYLAIAFLLTSDSVRKTFRETHDTDA
jgi:Na+/proline symporter